VGVWEVKARLQDIVENKMQNIEELMSFDQGSGVPSTFLVGVTTGRYMAYSKKAAEYWIERIKNEGFDVGVHGIAFDNLKRIEEEFKCFERLSNLDTFGIRMHYLKMSENTLTFLDKTGYLFDSSSYELKNPYKVGKLWEFPLHIMDGYILCNEKSWQNKNLKQAQQATMDRINLAVKNGIKYFTILFHDSYFSDSFKSWRDWYIWTVTYLKKQRMEFISFRKAIDELESEVT
jgi:hypothetical protein